MTPFGAFWQDWPSAFEWWTQALIPTVAALIAGFLGAATVFVGVVAWRTSTRSVDIAVEAEKAARRARIDDQMPRWRVSVWGATGAREGASFELNGVPFLENWTDEEFEIIEEDLRVREFMMPQWAQAYIVVTTRIRLTNYGPGGALLEVDLPRSRQWGVKPLDLGEGEKKESLIHRMETLAEWIRLTTAEDTRVVIGRFTYKSDLEIGAIDEFEVWMEGSVVRNTGYPGRDEWMIDDRNEGLMLRGVKVGVRRLPRVYFGDDLSFLEPPRHDHR